MSRGTDLGKFIQISNIPIDASEADLTKIFSTCGPIISFEFEQAAQGARKTRVVRVEYPDAVIAAGAIRELNGYIHRGQKLIVTAIDKFAAKQNAQLITGSQIDRSMTAKPAQGSKNVISEHYIQGIITSMTEREQAEILCEFKHLATNHPDQVRQLLTDSPQFAHTILTLMTMFQLVDQNTIQQYVAKGQQDLGLTEHETRLYERWKQYPEDQKENLRNQLLNADAQNNPQIAAFAATFRSLQAKLGVKL